MGVRGRNKGPSLWDCRRLGLLSTKGAGRLAPKVGGLGGNAQAPVWDGCDILECLPGFREAKSLGLIHIHFRLKVKDSQPF